jgi:hypothetical protein
VTQHFECNLASKWGGLLFKSEDSDYSEFNSTCSGSESPFKIFRELTQESYVDINVHILVSVPGQELKAVSIYTYAINHVI